ncbi:MAG: hypothetical protein D6693_10595 [Planctomycetota bacterium]|nr:MAG: hypothetical protein D6693_10595 [Planctomycetota bacterium]
MNARLLRGSALAGCIVGAGAIVWIATHGPRLSGSLLPPVSEQTLRAVQPARRADPYGRFEEVFAALPEGEMRDLVRITYEKDPVAAELQARSWAMAKDSMTGRAREVEPFLAALEAPLATLPEPGPLDTEPPRQPDERRRRAAMYGLSKAMISGLEYGDALFDRIEAAAVANFDVQDCRHNATVVLMLLAERRPLSPAGAEALARALDELPVYFHDHLRQQREDFAAGRQG